MLWPEDCELFIIHVKIEKPGSPAPAPPFPFQDCLQIRLAGQFNNVPAQPTELCLLLEIQFSLMVIS